MRAARTNCRWVAGWFGVIWATAVVTGTAVLLVGAEPPLSSRLPATAYVVPKQTCAEGEGYFALIEGLHRKLYIGTHANAVNSWLVEFDPGTRKMRLAVDAHQAAGIKASGFAAQSKIHTRNNTGASGKIYFATKQGYPTAGEKVTDYPGGYPMVYDPATDSTKVYPIPVPHHGIISITPDESRGLAYLSTCSDERPIDGTHFVVLDLKTGKYRDLMDCRHMYAFIVVDHLGRAYHPILGGDVARFDPQTGRVDRLKQTIDGQPLKADSHLADEHGHPINWDISSDGKTLYAVPMSTNKLYRYDLTSGGDTLAGVTVGPLLSDAKDTDCRAMCVGPSGRVWASVTAVDGGTHWHHLVSYKPGGSAPVDHGVLTVSNPDFTEFVDAQGKPLPYHAGFFKMSDGTLTTRYVTMGVCEARDGAVYTTVMHPYTLLRVEAERVK